MKIKETKIGESGILIEVFAEEGYVIDLGDGICTDYACIPKGYNIETIKEIPIED